MPLEIERKFLVRGTNWRTQSGVRIRQGYLNRDKHRTVRVRLAGTNGFLTIKGQSKGATRREYEYAIPSSDAEELLGLCERPLIEKIRHHHLVHNMHWEVDEFFGLNQGLVVAEVELQTEDQPFTRPEWLGEEVTLDVRYSNSRLSIEPYTSWSTATQQQRLE